MFKGVICLERRFVLVQRRTKVLLVGDFFVIEVRLIPLLHVFPYVSQGHDVSFASRNQRKSAPHRSAARCRPYFRLSDRTIKSNRWRSMTERQSAISAGSRDFLLRPVNVFSTSNNALYAVAASFDRAA